MTTLLEAPSPGSIRTKSPLEVLFKQPEYACMIIPPDQVERHKQLAEHYLTEHLNDPARWVGWDEKPPHTFLELGGVIPDWAMERSTKIIGSVPDSDVEIQVVFLLNDPFFAARCATTGETYHFALWDGDGHDATHWGEESHRAEIRFDWTTVLPTKLAGAAAGDWRELYS